MECPGCHHENPDDSRFCGECGTSLMREVTCSTCGRSNPGDQKFCNSCGTSLKEIRNSKYSKSEIRNVEGPSVYTPKHLAEKILASRGALRGERKHVTVLFADVKGSMDLAERMDPEEWSKIMKRFFEILSDGVERFEGFVDKFTGDGIMALFGAPIAHEDHAQRACYAALRLRDELRRYADELRLSRGLDFAARMGLNSGEVVVGTIGDDLRMEYTAQGHTVGLAARMEALAPPGGVCVSEATARLVSGYVTLRDLGAAEIKAASEPVRVFELEGADEIRSRFDVARARGLTRFVGRDDDMGVLEQALAQARAGNGQIVGVVAEAGAGKSRLCFEFVEHCRARGLTVLHGAAAVHGKDVPLSPILQILRQYFGINEQEGDRAARERIAGRLLLIDEGVREFLPGVFDFMAVSDPERPSRSVDPEVRQRQLFNVMRRVVASGAGAAVTFIEDLHWIDAGSAAWLEQMVETAGGSNTLLVVNFRPEYHAAWIQKPWYRQVPLPPLSPEAIRELLGDLLGSDPSIASLADKIQERTAGNPFFAEEIVQNLVESGDLQGRRGAYRLSTPVGQLEVPGTVQSVLAARIDRLGERAKEALQTAAVIGREFSEAILAVALDWPDGDLATALQVLKSAEFICEQSLYPVAEYAFKHPLTQEVALGSQLRERRARTHGAVARALETAHADRLDEHAALIAQHWEAAGDGLHAARWHRRAASALLGRGVPESLAHWKRVYELAASHAETREALEMRFEACGKLVMASYQVGIPRHERDRLAAEGRQIAEQLGDPVALFSIDLYLVISQLLSGWSGAAPLDATQRAVKLADEIDLGVEVRVGARLNHGNIAWTAGRVAEALQAAEEALDLAGGDLELGTQLAGFSFVTLALYMKGVLLVWLGRPREGVTYLERASAQGDLLLSQIVAQAALVQELTGSPQEALACCRRAVEINERVGDLFNRTITTIHLGWAQLMHGDVTGALESLLGADRLQRERGIASNHLNLGQGLLAEAYLAAGDAANARIVASRCAAELDAWVWELRAHLSRSRVLRALDGADARAEIEASLARADLLLEWSGARAFAPFIVEERARLCEVLGDEKGAARHVREARRLFVEVEATGHAERLAKELGGYGSDMQCTACRHDNREGRRFCAERGAKLSLVCAACGAENTDRETARFCRRCGHPLAATFLAGS